MNCGISILCVPQRALVSVREHGWKCFPRKTLTVTDKICVIIIQFHHPHWKPRRRPENNDPRSPPPPPDRYRQSIPSLPRASVGPKMDSCWPRMESSYYPVLFIRLKSRRILAGRPPSSQLSCLIDRPLADNSIIRSLGIFCNLYCILYPKRRRPAVPPPRYTQPCPLSFRTWKYGTQGDPVARIRI